jgi:hypothetical protein
MIALAAQEKLQEDEKVNAYGKSARYHAAAWAIRSMHTASDVRSIRREMQSVSVGRWVLNALPERKAQFSGLYSGPSSCGIVSPVERTPQSARRQKRLPSVATIRHIHLFCIAHPISQSARRKSSPTVLAVFFAGGQWPGVARTETPIFGR